MVCSGLAVSRGMATRSRHVMSWIGNQWCCFTVATRIVNKPSIALSTLLTATFTKDIAGEVLVVCDEFSVRHQHVMIVKRHCLPIHLLLNSNDAWTCHRYSKKPWLHVMQKATTTTTTTSGRSCTTTITITAKH